MRDSHLKLGPILIALLIFAGLSATALAEKTESVTSLVSAPPPVRDLLEKANLPVLDLSHEPALQQLGKELAALTARVRKPEDGKGTLHVVLTDDLRVKAGLLDSSDGGKVLWLSQGTLRYCQSDSEIAAIVSTQLSEGLSTLDEHLNSQKFSLENQLKNIGLARLRKAEASAQAVITRLHQSGYEERAMQTVYRRMDGETSSNDFSNKSVQSGAIDQALALIVRGSGGVLQEKAKHEEVLPALRKSSLSQDSYLSSRRHQAQELLHRPFPELPTLFEEANQVHEAPDYEYALKFQRFSENLLRERWIEILRLRQGLVPDAESQEQMLELSATLEKQLEALRSTWIAKFQPQNLHQVTAMSPLLFTVPVLGFPLNGHQEDIPLFRLLGALVKAEKSVTEIDQELGAATSAAALALREKKRHLEEYVQKLQAGLDLELKRFEGNKTEIDRLIGKMKKDLAASTDYFHPPESYLVSLHELAGHLKHIGGPLRRARSALRAPITRVLDRSEPWSEKGPRASDDYTVMHALDGLNHPLRSLYPPSEANELMATSLMNQARRQMANGSPIPPDLQDVFLYMPGYNVGEEKPTWLAQLENLVAEMATASFSTATDFKALQKAVLEISRVEGQQAVRPAQIEAARVANRRLLASPLRTTEHSVDRLSGFLQALDSAQLLSPGEEVPREEYAAAVSYLSKDSTLQQWPAEVQKFIPCLLAAVACRFLKGPIDEKEITEALKRAYEPSLAREALKHRISPRSLYGLFDAANVPFPEASVARLITAIPEWIGPEVTDSDLIGQSKAEVGLYEKRKTNSINVVYNLSRNLSPELYQALDRFCAFDHRSELFGQGSRALYDLALNSEAQLIWRELFAQTDLPARTLADVIESHPEWLEGVRAPLGNILSGVQTQGSPPDWLEREVKSNRADPHFEIKVAIHFFEVIQEVMTRLRRAGHPNLARLEHEVKNSFFQSYRAWRDVDLANHPPALQGRFFEVSSPHVRSGTEARDLAFLEMWEKEPALRQRFKDPKWVAELHNPRNRAMLALWQLEQSFSEMAVGANPPHVSPTEIRPVVATILKKVDEQLKNPSVERNFLLDQIEERLVTTPAESDAIHSRRLTTENWYLAPGIALAEVPYQISQRTTLPHDKVEFIEYLMGIRTALPSCVDANSAGTLKAFTEARDFYGRSHPYVRASMIAPLMDSKEKGALHDESTRERIFRIALGARYDDPRWRVGAHAYYDQLQPEEKDSVIAYLLSIRGTNGKEETPTQQGKKVLEAVPPLGIRIGQGVRSIGLLPAHEAASYDDFLDNALPPHRPKVLADLKAAFGKNWGDVVYVGKRAGSGSVNYGVEVWIRSPSTGLPVRTFVKILRDDAEGKAKHENDLLAGVAEKMRQHSSPAVRNWGEMIDEFRLAAMENLKKGGAELDHRKERGKYDAAQSAYGLERDPKTGFVVKAVPWIKEFQDKIEPTHQSKVSIYEWVEGKSVNKVEDPRRRADLAGLVQNREMHALRLNAYDEDAHRGNWLVDEEHKTLFRLDYAQLDSDPPEGRAAADQVVRILLGSTLSNGDLRELIHLMPHWLEGIPSQVPEEELFQAIRKRANAKDFPKKEEMHQRAFAIREVIREELKRKGTLSTPIYFARPFRRTLTSIAKQAILREETGDLAFIRGLFDGLGYVPKGGSNLVAYHLGSPLGLKLVDVCKRVRKAAGLAL